MVAIEILRGNAFSIYALEINDRRELLDYLYDLSRSSGREYRKLVQYLEWTKEIGLLKTEEIFKRLTSEIYEFKTPGGIRVLCFRHGRSLLILTNGFKKKKTYDDEIARAERLRVAYLTAKQNGTLVHREEFL